MPPRSNNPVAPAAPVKAPSKVDKVLLELVSHPDDTTVLKPRNLSSDFEKTAEKRVRFSDADSVAPSSASNPAGYKPANSHDTTALRDAYYRTDNSQSADHYADTPSVTLNIPQAKVAAVTTAEAAKAPEKAAPCPIDWKNDAKSALARCAKIIQQQIDAIEQSFFSHNKQAKIDVLQTLYQKLTNIDNIEFREDAIDIIDNWQKELLPEQKTILVSHRGFSCNSRAFLTESEKVLVKIRNDITFNSNINKPEEFIKRNIKQGAKVFHRKNQPAPSASYFSGLTSWLPSCSWFPTMTPVYQALKQMVSRPA